MTADRHGDGAGLLGRTLHDITQLLETADAAEERTRRVLGLLRVVVPYEQCALLEVRPGHERLLMQPEPRPDDRARLVGRVGDLFGRLLDARRRALAPATRLNGHLAVPLVALDDVIGLLMVESSGEAFNEEHLRVLSLVAAKLSAYLAMVQARGELAELVRERDEARRSAERAGRAKDEFLALVSDELKAQLTSILACTHVLRSPASDAGQVHALDEIDGNVQKQSRLIDDILELARIRSARLRLDLRTVEPAALIRATIEGLRLEAERSSVRIEYNLEASAMPLLLDPDRIGQVLSTVISSAISFSLPGAYVQVRLERAGEQTRIQVTSGGGDVSSEVLAGLFDRVPVVSGGGTGAPGRLDVRLAIAKDLVALHGGRIHAESDGPGRGAIFTLDLPNPSRPPAGPGPSPPGTGSDGRLLSGVRVLLIDHDLGLREALQSVLDDQGAQVTAVASASEALAALEQSRTDVLLFGDLAVRGDGVYDLMRQVMLHACPLPAASISSWRLEERERALAAGIRLHLVKPLRVDSLIDAVASLAGRSPLAPGDLSRD